jgi:hypothetical protein
MITGNNISLDLDCSSRRRGPRTTPRSRALAGKTAKEPVEVRLIGKTAIHGDLCQGRGCCEHQPLRPFDSPSHQVRVRRVVKASPEHAGKIKGTESYLVGKFGGCNPSAEVGFDVCQDFTNLPACEAASRYEAGVLRGLSWYLRAFRPDCVGEVKNRPDTLNIVLDNLRVILQSVANRADECRDCPSKAFKRALKFDPSVTLRECPRCVVQEPAPGYQLRDIWLYSRVSHHRSSV